MNKTPTRIALIGTGMVGRTYAIALADLTGQVHLTKILARRSGSSDRFIEAECGHLPERPATASLTEIATDPDIGFVILATPPDARHAFVDTLTAHGKPILMEKPVERTLANAKALCTLAETRGIPLGMVLQHRARPSARTLKDWLTKNVPGTLQALEISVPWWRPQSYYDEPRRGTYARDGGGVLLTQAIHTLDLALQFTPEVTEVTALSATSPFHDMEAEDFVTAGLRFRTGAVGSLFATTATFPGRSEEIRLHYQKCSITLRTAELEFHHHDGRTEKVGTAAASGAGGDPMAFTSDWHRDIIADFDTALRENRPPLAPARSALPAHALIDAIERSAKTGAPTQPEPTP